MDFTFDAHDNRIGQNTRDINKLGYKVNELDKNLSAGIASAVALSFMPTNNIAGSHMITGGSGFYNGESAVAVGFSGTTIDGKYTYKVGGSWATEGGGTGGAGLGYRWK
ncbi:YadA-like family protein [Psychrobacter frigidicola]|uniref:YadA-like family protein n=1 Tax=Psychrobacter frigidicola TaxID=45611 RepID=UPI001917C803|nr:YadA-like family protein [Psychrobacter frigidicola]